jgi:hypothetical protein
LSCSGSEPSVTLLPDWFLPLIVFFGVVSDTISFAIIYNKKISLMKAKNHTCRFLFLKRNRMNKGLLLVDTWRPSSDTNLLAWIWTKQNNNSPKQDNLVSKLDSEVDRKITRSLIQICKNSRERMEKERRPRDTILNKIILYDSWAVAIENFTDLIRKLINITLEI